MEKDEREEVVGSVIDFAQPHGDNEYDSKFETDSESVVNERALKDLVEPAPIRREPLAHQNAAVSEYSFEEKRRVVNCLLALDAHTRHEKLMKVYPGATSKVKSNTSPDRTDFEFTGENLQFYLDESDEEEPPSTWEKKLAKQYYDKVFNEYCTCDLTYYKANKIAMRWRNEQGVISGKGQFTCGDKRCQESSGLRTWEVKFAYFEEDEKKISSVKLRLCSKCSFKFNYRLQKKEVTKTSAKRTSSKLGGATEEKKSQVKETSEEKSNKEPLSAEEEAAKEGKGSVCSKPSIAEEKSEGDDFDSYMADMLL